MKNIKTYTLPNGIKVVYQHLITTNIVHCGIILDIGSRDENFNNQEQNNINKLINKQINADSQVDSCSHTYNNNNKNSNNDNHNRY